MTQENYRLINQALCPLTGDKFRTIWQAILASDMAQFLEQDRREQMTEFVKTGNWNKMHSTQARFKDSNQKEFELEIEAEPYVYDKSDLIRAAEMVQDQATGDFFMLAKKFHFKVKSSWFNGNLDESEKNAEFYSRVIALGRALEQIEPVETVRLYMFADTYKAHQEASSQAQRAQAERSFQNRLTEFIEKTPDRKRLRVGAEFNVAPSEMVQAGMQNFVQFAGAHMVITRDRKQWQVTVPVDAETWTYVQRKI